MSTTKIEWTDRTWNPVTGCSKISAGCAHCYAQTMARRLKAMGVAKYANGFTQPRTSIVLDEPIRWETAHNFCVLYGRSFS